MKHDISLKTWLSLMLGAFLLVQLIAFFLVGRYAEQTMRRNAVSFNENLLQVYMEKLDENIEGISRFLSRYAASQEAISVLARSTDESERFFAVQDIMRQLENGAFLYDNFSGLFVYSQGVEEDRFLCRMSEDTSQQQLEDIRDIVTGAGEPFSTNGWELVDGEGQSFLIQAVRTGSTSCGAWIDVAALALPIEKIELGETGRILFLDQEGCELPHREKGLYFGDAGTGSRVSLEGGWYLAIKRSSTLLPITLQVLIPEKEFTRDSRIQQVVAVVCCMVLLCFPLLKIMLRRFISAPVERMTRAMGAVEEGRLDVQVEMGEVFREFRIIGERFNHMVQRIHQLQQDVYERQLQVQKTQLQYLQMQIRPHFFLNALNSLYAYVLTARYDLVEKLTLCLSQYFRYMLGSSAAFVALGRELQHVSNYMQIQQMRRPGQLNYTQELEQTLADALLPPLVVQTFIENSIKYGEPEEGPLEISLLAEPVFGGPEQMRIMICDNGKGYSAGVLQAFAQGKPLGDERCGGIGIENVRRRLELSYGGRAALHISNGPDGGAVTEILIPLCMETSKEDADDDFTGG